MAKKGPRFTETEREDRLCKVARLDRRGWSQSDIARECLVTQQTVSNDLKEIRQRYKVDMLAEHDEMVAQTVAEYREIISELWAAWERSKEDAVKTVEERAPIDTTPPVEDEAPRRKRGLARLLANPNQFEFRKIKEVMTREGRLPAAEYMKLILNAREGIRSLLGLDAAKKVDMDVFGKIIPWDVMYEEAEGEVSDEIEDQIMEGLPALTHLPTSSNGSPRSNGSPSNGKH